MYLSQGGNLELQSKAIICYNDLRLPKTEHFKNVKLSFL